MKTLILLATLGICHAAALEYGTAVTGTSMFSSFGTPVVTVPNAAWAPAIGNSYWVGPYADTNSGNVPNGFEITYSLIFVVPGSPAAGTLTILADDEASLFVNGTKLADDLLSGPAKNCAIDQPNCLLPLTLDIEPYLKTGGNTVMATVAQRWGGPTGLDIDGTVRYGSPIPEPSTFVLVGLALALIAKQRRQ
jgi:hypothetical protein